MAFSASMTGYRHALPALWQQPVTYEPNQEIPYLPQPALAPQGGALVPPAPTQAENTFEFIQDLAPIAAAGLAGGPAGLLIALAAGTAAQTFRGQKQRERDRELALRAAETEAAAEAEQTAWDRNVEVEKLRIERQKANKPIVVDDSLVSPQGEVVYQGQEQAPELEYADYDKARKNITAAAEDLEAITGPANFILGLEEGTPIGEYAAGKLFEKILDPTSVVRPTEAEASAEVQGIYNKLRGMYESAKGAGGLSIEAIADLKATVARLYDIAANEAEPRIDQEINNAMIIPGMTEQMIRGLIPSRIDVSPYLQQEAPPPPPGAVLDE